MNKVLYMICLGIFLLSGCTNQNCCYQQPQTVTEGHKRKEIAKSEVPSTHVLSNHLVQAVNDSSLNDLKTPLLVSGSAGLLALSSLFFLL